MAKLLVLLLHNFLFPIALVFMTPAALRKLKARGGKTSDLWQRFGFFRPEQRAQLSRLRERGPTMWVHAASVGEVGIAAKLIKKLLKLKPDWTVVLTTTTPTGFAQAEALSRSVGGAVLPLYSALDGWLIVRRFLRAIQPKQLILIEAEVWPNLTYACEARGIPVRLTNARLSPRSERRFRKSGFIARTIFSMLDQILVQEPEDVARWASLVHHPDRISLTGSIKFDHAVQDQPTSQVQEFRAILRDLGWDEQDPVLLAASTHDGEEAALLQATESLRARIPHLRWIIVPRHVERAPQILETLNAAGTSVVLRSKASVVVSAPPEVLLVDTTGELRAWQYLASVVIIGKSFLAEGGQNPAEGIAAGKPVVMGPHMENFDLLVQQLLQARGALQVADLAALAPALESLLQTPEIGQETVERGQAVLRTHEGATRRTALRLLEV